ncbi:unnamed protein product [Dicrocoelium dendriticum]|nr:unnamed protein product [Dicrocoelium dendriticum]
MSACFMESHSKVEQLKHHEFLFGGLAYSISVIALFPCYKTIFFQQLDGVSWPAAFARLRHEGPYLAYRGVLPPLLQRCSSGAVMFGVQSLTERTLSHHPLTVSVSPTLNKLISSVSAGLCEVPLMPLERVQTLLQNSHCFPSYRNTFHTLNSLVCSHGLRELYRGVTPVILRNTSANALYFSGHKWLSDLYGCGADRGPIERSLLNFAFGALLGGFIGIFTFPLNVIKTRMQSTVGGDFETLRHTFTSLLYHDSDRPDISRLYRGLPANFLRSLASWGIITMTYHFLLELY